MAVQGLRSFLHAPLTAESPLTYGIFEKTTGAIEVQSDITYNDAKIFSDDRLKHKDVSFSEGVITLTADYIDKEIFSPILGRAVKTDSFTPAGGSEPVTVKKHVSNTNDMPIPLGFGYIKKDFDVDAKKDVYSVKFFYHVEFQPPTEPEQTKQGQKTYQQATVTGTIYELENGDWCEEEDFAELKTAIEYLKSLFASAEGE